MEWDRYRSPTTSQQIKAATNGNSPARRRSIAIQTGRAHARTRIVTPIVERERRHIIEDIDNIVVIAHGRCSAAIV